MAKGLSFEAKDRVINEVLFANCIYRIPRYQRPYAWDNDEVEEFWNDLISMDGSPFIGSMIFNYESLEKTGFIDVIDGQQRLLTITIFIATLRDIVKSVDNTAADLYQRQDIAIEDRTGSQTFRIITGDSTREFFETYIQDPAHNILESKPQTHEEQRIYGNYMFFRDKINTGLKKYSTKLDQKKYLDDLRKKAANLAVIHIKITSETDAYEIFETTNARGIDLTVTDLLKNLIFKQIPASEDKDVAKAFWEDMTTDIEAADTDMKKFIRYYWMSKHNPVTERRLYREIKKETTDYVDLLYNMCESANWYNKIITLNENDWNNIKNGYKIFSSLRAIKIMNVSQCYVLFLSILRNLNKLATDPTRIFQIVEKFTFQYSVVCRLPTNRIEKIFAHCAKKIEDAIATENAKNIGGKIQSVLSTLETDLKKEAPTKAYFIEKFLDLSYKNSEQNRMLMKYILSSIDTHFRETKEQSIDFSQVNIEHILPKAPTKSWGLSKKNIKSYVDKLGNLTLVDKHINSKIGNKAIKDKLGELKKSSLPITQELIKEIIDNDYQWNEDCIFKRHNDFADIAYTKIWSL